uniref:Xenotropic and polytropic retrovirus receptor 1 n=1 Tax=Parascaris univalens TaxID=6257 RepID=A0A915BID9_PARUN
RLPERFLTFSVVSATDRKRRVRPLNACAPKNSSVLRCAALGHQSVGLELNILLVLYSKYKARHQHLSHLAAFHRKDIFRADLTKYRSAVIFGTERVMDDLVPKLDEMLTGSYLIAFRFPLPSNTRWRLIWKVEAGIDSVWLYEKCPYIVPNS